MNKNTKEYIKQWILKANEDVLVVEKLTESGIFAPSTACFHCQQAVEKFLKAFLFANGVEVRKTHNIEFLLSECVEIDSDFKAIEPGNLSDFGVDVRYPGDMYIPSDKETIHYKEIALSV